jgi:hypothetical protein
MKAAVAFGLNLVNPEHYQGWGGPLTGCCPDASSMVAVAGQRGYDVATSRLNTYAGPMTALGHTIPPYRLVMDATAANWIALHRKYAELAQPGDCFVFSFSGHGARRIYVLSATESFCFSERMMDDAEFKDLMALWPAGVRVLYVLDCCYAGGMHRNLGFLGRPKTAGLQFSRQPKPDYAPTRAAVRADIAIWAACAAEQVALDGQYNGAFTGSLLAMLEQHPLADVPTLHEHLRGFMRRHFPNQTPQLNFLGQRQVWAGRPAWT